MRKRISKRKILTLVLGASLLASGSTLAGHGAPPRRAAGGYVYYYEPAGVRLVFNIGLGLYVVEAHPGVYYYSGTFYRVDNGIWVATSDFKAGKWKKIKHGSLPPGLAKKT